MHIDIHAVANLANLILTPQAAARLEGQLSSILGYVDTLQKVDASDLANAKDMKVTTNVYREDIKTSIPHNTIHYKVPRILS